MAQHGNKFSRLIYNVCPPVVQSFMATLYGFSTSFKKYGKYYKKYFDYLKKSQWMTTEQIERFQLKKLKDLIAYAVKYVPYYTDLFNERKLSPDDIQTIQDLQKLPVLTKEDVRKNFQKLISTQYTKKDLIVTSTSGSTGKSLEIVLTKEAYQKQQAIIWFHRSWGDVHYKDKTATCSGHRLFTASHNHPPFWVNNYFENQILFSSYHLSEKNLKFYADKLMRFEPKLIWGYPSALYLIASYLKKHNISAIQPNAVYTSSETLLKHQKDLLKTVFQSKVFNYYATAESIVSILECEKSKLHILPESGIVEFLDENNQPVKSGDEGKMICTGLLNYAMPLIRYDIGDFAIPSDSKCSCGRNSPIVLNISGRMDDYIVTPEGKLLVRIGGIHSIKHLQEVQFVQKDKNSLQVNIVKDSEYNMDDTSRIFYLIKNRVGKNMNIYLNFVDTIPRGANGKFKYMKSEVESARFFQKD